MSTPPTDPLLTPRAALLLLLSVVVGVAAGCLGYLARNDVPTAVLIAGGAAGGALALFRDLLGS